MLTDLVDRRMLVYNLDLAVSPVEKIKDTHIVIVYAVDRFVGIMLRTNAVPTLGAHLAAAGSPLG